MDGDYRMSELDDAEIDTFWIWLVREMDLRKGVFPVRKVVILVRCWRNDLMGKFDPRDVRSRGPAFAVGGAESPAGGKRVGPLDFHCYFPCLLRRF